MADVELVIKIPERIYKDIMAMTMQHISGLRSGKSFLVEILKAIRTGIPLPKGHGKIIDENRITEVYIQTTEKEYINGVLIPPRIKITGTNAPYNYTSRCTKEKRRYTT